MDLRLSILYICQHNKLSWSWDLLNRSGLLCRRLAMADHVIRRFCIGLDACIHCGRWLQTMFGSAWVHGSLSFRPTIRGSCVGHVLAVEHMMNEKFWGSRTFLNVRRPLFLWFLWFCCFIFFLCSLTYFLSLFLNVIFFRGEGPNSIGPESPPLFNVWLYIL